MTSFWKFYYNHVYKPPGKIPDLKNKGKHGNQKKIFRVMRKIYQRDFFLSDESVGFLLSDRRSVPDYEAGEECGSLTTQAWRTVPPRAAKHIILVPYQHTRTQQLPGCESCRDPKCCSTKGIVQLLMEAGVKGKICWSSIEAGRQLMTKLIHDLFI